VQNRSTLQLIYHFILKSCENVPQSSRHELDTNSLVASQVLLTPGAIGYVDLGTAAAQLLNTVLLDGQQPLPANVANNTYKFWATEHLFTKGIAQGLAKAFLDYMTSDTAKVVATTLKYVDYNLMAPQALASHQSQSVC